MNKHLKIKECAQNVTQTKHQLKSKLVSEAARLLIFSRQDDAAPVNLRNIVHWGAMLGARQL